MIETPGTESAPASGGGRLRAKPRVHLRFLDGFRGFVALYVVLYHAKLQNWPEFSGAPGPTGWTRALTSWLSFGELAVTCFIAISGFCLMLPVLGNNGTLGGGGRGGFTFAGLDVSSHLTIWLFFFRSRLSLVSAPSTGANFLAAPVR